MSFTFLFSEFSNILSLALSLSLFHSFSSSLSSCLEWHSRDHGRLHVRVSEHSRFIALASHEKLAHMLDSMIRRHIEAFTIHCSGSAPQECRLTYFILWTSGCRNHAGFRFHHFDTQSTVEAFSYHLGSLLLPPLTHACLRSEHFHIQRALRRDHSGSTPIGSRDHL